MSAPKHNDKSAPLTCPRNIHRLVDLLVDEVFRPIGVPWLAPATTSGTGCVAASRRLQRVHGCRTELFTSTRILDAEERLVAAAGRTDGRS